MTTLFDKDRAGLNVTNDGAIPAQETGHQSTPIPSLLSRSREWFKHAWGTIKPGPLAWKGAALGTLAVAVLSLLVTAYTVFLAQPRIVSFLLGTVEFLAIAAVVGALVVLLIALLKRIPSFYAWALGFTIILLYVSFFITTPASQSGMLSFMLAVIVVASLLGAAVWVLVRHGWRSATGIQRIITVLGLGLGLGGLAAGAIWLGGPGPAVEPPPSAAAMSAAKIMPLQMPDPSQPGQYKVKTLSYGTGTDRQRPEYGANVDLVTGAVDGSPFTSGWSSARINYWGFGPGALPINGRVWYPDGTGPFLLVLVVHGDRIMNEFSDPGYDYLGELLASRGFILASVDVNFLNFEIPSGPPKDENDARGWLLNEDPAPGIDGARNTAPQNPSGEREPVDLTIEVMDRSGRAVRLPLSTFSYLQPQIVMNLMKAPFMNVTGPAPSEPIFQSFEFPLAAFMKADPAFDPTNLTTVRFIFDRSPAGVVVLDDLGFRK